MSSDDQKRPSLCIINFNGAKYLPDTLNKATEFQDQFFEIMLVDNGSTDTSVQLVEEQFPKVRIIKLSQNRGAGGARNAGIEAAKSRLVLFLDNDVLLLESCATHLLRAFEQYPNAILAAPCVRYRHDPETVQFCGADNHFLGLMDLHEENQPVRDIPKKVRKTDSVVTASFLIDRAKLADQNRFDEIYFYQMEDHDFGVSQRVRGFDILAVPEAQVLHGHGAEGMSIRESGNYSIARIYGLIRNRWIFILKFYRWRTIAVLSPVLFIYEVAQLAIVVKKGWFKEWRQSLDWIIKNRRMILSRRKTIQAMRSINDRHYLKGGPIPHRQELTANRLEVLARAALNRIALSYWIFARHLI